VKYGPGRYLGSWGPFNLLLIGLACTRDRSALWQGEMVMGGQAWYVRIAQQEQTTKLCAGERGDRADGQHTAIQDSYHHKHAILNLLLTFKFVYRGRGQ
jgi:hypothetical protein